MKRIAILVLALSLAACATIQNPVSQGRVDALNASWGAVLAIAAGYHDACAQRLIPPDCRPIVVKMQQAAIPVQAAVRRARLFAKNPTTSTVDLVQAASDAVNDFKVLQMQLGVK